MLFVMLHMQNQSSDRCAASASEYRHVLVPFQLLFLPHWPVNFDRVLMHASSLETAIQICARPAKLSDLSWEVPRNAQFSG